MDDIIVFQLLKTKRRLTFDILYQRDDTRYRGEDDGDYFTFKASNGYEVISRSRMDIQTERLWLLGAAEDERSGSMVFSSDEKRDRAYDQFLVALREWVEFIRTGGWGTRPTPELYVPVVPEPAGVPVEVNAASMMAAFETQAEQECQAFVESHGGETPSVNALLHLNGFATELDAAALLGIDMPTLQQKITERSVFALPEPRTGAWRIPVWALHLDLMGLHTLRLHDLAGGSNEWEIHAFMSTPNSALHGLRPFECLVDTEHLPLKLRAMREALLSTLHLETHQALVDTVIQTLRHELTEIPQERQNMETVRPIHGAWEN